MPGGVTVTIGAETPKVSRISIQRGRQDELDRTGTGTATVSLVYTSGSVSDFIGEDVTIELTNPFGGSSPVFVGIVDEMAYDLSRSQIVTRVDLTCCDAMDFFAGIEMAPGVHGHALPANVDAGNIFWEQQLPGSSLGSAVLDGRIGLAIEQSGWGGDVELFSGNVQLMDTVYSPRTSLLTVILDAAEAEFPGVSNVYVQKDGTFTFHGRFARFNPAVADYHITTYTAGDYAAAASDPTMARVAELRLGSSRQRLINAALATPQGIADADIEGQVVTDPVSIATYGTRSWSAENLLTLYDEATNLTANAAVKQFAQYYVDNYSTPRTRVEGVTFKSRDPDWLNAEATWDLICGADISDIITLNVQTNPGVAINEDFFVEGVRMEIEPLNSDYALVSATYDLSPRSYWDADF